MEALYVTIGQIALVGVFFCFTITPILQELEARCIHYLNFLQVLASFPTC